MEDRICLNCGHATPLYERAKGNPVNPYEASGIVKCFGPRYRGRWYPCRDNKKGCSEFKQRGRPS